MKKIMMIALFGILASCSPGMHPEYANNVETVKTFLELQANESDVNAQMSMVSEELEWQPAFHGATPIGKEAFKAYLLNWQDQMEAVMYTPENFLPGVLVETGLSDGSVRSYGEWTGTHTATGKKWAFISYHTWDFKDGKIISGGDYFDAGGLTAFLQPSQVAVEVSYE